MKGALNMDANGGFSVMQNMLDPLGYLYFKSGLEIPYYLL